MKIISALFGFVRLTRRMYNIDESHGLSHSMDVFIKADEIYRHEVSNYPYLKKQKHIIDAAAILHDTCDKKYMNSVEGLQRIRYFLQDKYSFDDIDIISNIISQMSYSYVTKFGYPDLHNYQTAYHIVREADLLSAYDIDRSIIYDMEVNNNGFIKSFENSDLLFENRMGKYISDELFITEYSKKLSIKLESECIERMNAWKNAIDLTSL